MSLDKRGLNNIIWHIETNREVLGDTRTLDDVFQSLRNMGEPYISKYGYEERNRKVVGETKTLNQVLLSLKTLVAES